MKLPTVSPRRAAAVNAGKLAALASRVLGRGGGTALPGVVAEVLYGNLARDLARQLECGSFLVSGTNGKTTTSRLLGAILRAARLSPLRNRSGSNLMRGVASSLLEDADVWGNMRRGEDRLGLFEIDEAALPGLVSALQPRGLLLLNLFRDQLDRYGEVATVARLWSDALATLSSATGVIVNGDDPLLAHATELAESDVLYFGLQSADRAAEAPEHASDVKACPRCGAEIRYSTVFLGHLGHYRCDACGFERPRPVVYARDVCLRGFRGSRFVIVSADEEYTVSLPLPGMYNVYNAVAAAAAAVWLGIPPHVIGPALELVTPAFGRMERLDIDGRSVYIALAKNPAGFNEVIRTAVQDDTQLHLMVMLNDNIADGHDVSWIWDTDIEMLRGRVASVVFGGTRAADMALRFKYAEVTPADGRTGEILANTETAFRSALQRTPPGAQLLIVPTYTALLDIRSVLTRLGYVKPYWEE